MSDSSEYPAVVARFYDVVYQSVLDGADRDYYLRKLTDVSGPVLEAGVGTGRIFLDALDRGADIHGIDANESMLAQLRRKLPAEHHHRLACQDLRRLDLVGRYGLIVAPFRVFSHLITIEDQLGALERVESHLTPGGKLIFDVFVPNHGMLASGLDEVRDFDGEHAPGRKLQRFTSMTANPLSQTSRVTMRFVWDEDDGEHTETWSFPLRYFFRYELEHLIERSRLELEAIYGDFDESPLGPGSKEFVVHCRKVG